MGIRLQIAVAVIFSPDKRRVLVSRRHAQADQGGLWEFPGGKCHSDEDTLSALKRELFEELNMEIVGATELMKIDYDYPELKVCLNVWSVSQWKGNLFGKEGQPIEWVDINKLPLRDFPKANEKIISFLNE